MSEKSSEWMWVTFDQRNLEVSDRDRTNGMKRIRSGAGGYHIVLDTDRLLVYEVTYTNLYAGQLFAYVHRSLLSSPER